MKFVTDAVRLVIPLLFVCCGAKDRVRTSATLPSATLSAADVAIDLRTATCLGQENATSFAIYLHGMDSESPSEQEMTNREILGGLAKKHALRIALPRAKMACPSQAGSVCWGWSFDAAELDAATATIRAAAHACFGDRSATAIGFSNGGYLLTNVLRDCSLRRTLPQVTRLITVGATMMTGAIVSKPASFADCGDLTMLVGTKDEHNLDPSENLLRHLRSKNAAVREVRFEGGHHLERASLEQTLFDLPK